MTENNSLMIEDEVLEYAGNENWIYDLEKWLNRVFDSKDTNYSDTLRRRILELSQDSGSHWIELDKYGRSISSNMKVIFSLEQISDKYIVNMIKRCMKYDPQLKRLKSSYVPAKVKEAVFWSTYFSKLYEIMLSESRQKVQGTREILKEFNFLVNSLKNKEKENTWSENTPLIDADENKKSIFRTHITDSNEEIMSQALFDVYEFFNSLAPETLSKDSFHTQSDNVAVCAFDFASQAILVHQLTSRTSYQVIAKEDCLVLRGPTKEVMRQQVVHLVRQHLQTSLSEDQVMDLIGYANSDEYEGLQWIINPIDYSRRLSRAHEPISVHVALAKDGTIIAAAILLLFRKLISDSKDHSNDNHTDAEHQNVKVKNSAQVQDQSYNARLFMSSEKCSNVLMIDLPSRKERPIQVNLDTTFVNLSEMCKFSDMQALSKTSWAKLLSHYSCILCESSRYGYAGVLNGDVPIFVFTSKGGASSSECSENDYKTTQHAAGLFLLQKLFPDILLTDFTGAPISCTHRGRLLRNGLKEGILACVSHLQAPVLNIFRYINHVPAQSFEITIKDTFADEDMVKSALKLAFSIGDESLQIRRI